MVGADTVVHIVVALSEKSHNGFSILPVRTRLLREESKDQENQNNKMLEVRESTKSSKSREEEEEEEREGRG